MDLVLVLVVGCDIVRVCSHRCPQSRYRRSIGVGDALKIKFTQALGYHLDVPVRLRGAMDAAIARSAAAATSATANATDGGDGGGGVGAADDGGGVGGGIIGGGDHAAGGDRAKGAPAPLLLQFLAVQPTRTSLRYKTNEILALEQEAEDAQRQLLLEEFAIFSELRDAVLGCAELVLAVSLLLWVGWCDWRWRWCLLFGWWEE
jgi:hypothetical protein